MSNECFRIGDVELNAGTKQVTRHGEPISLPPLSFKLLHILARHAPNVATVRQLEEEVWSGLVVDRGTINKRVLLVRNALAAAGCAGDYIVAIRGTGYRLSVPVERLPDCVDCAELPASESPKLAEPGQSVSWRTVAAMGVVVAVAMLLHTVIENYHDSESLAQPAPGKFATAGNRVFAGGTSSIPSMAVLPFDDLGESGADSYLGDGIAREVITLLNGIENIEIASPTSSFAFRNPDEPVASVAAQLNVEALLRGSVERFGERIHVVTRLVRAETGENLWSASYGGNLDEVFRIQDDIASNVAMALHVGLDADELPNSRQGSTGNVEAFTHFLKGRAEMDNRVALGAEGLRRSLQHFEQAIALDPEFDRAYVGLASAIYLLPAYNGGLDVASSLERSEASVRFALELNPGSSEALGVLAAIMFRRGHASQAAALFKRALDQGNSDPNIMHWYAMLFQSMGYFEELIPGLEEAVRMDPLNPLLSCSLAAALNLSGNHEESFAVFSSVQRFPSRDLGLALASIYLEDFDTAREMLRDIRLWTGNLPRSYADLLVAAFENPLLYQSAEEAFVKAAHDGELPRLLAFESLLILGSPMAFDLEADVSGTPFEFRLPEPVWNNSAFNLRRDPRFKNWIRALGYDRYWRKHGWPDRCRPTGLDDFECV